MADTVGGVASPDKYDYTAFGDAIGFTASSAKTKWLFGGDGVYDPASGFTYHLARWRSGFLFTSRDSYAGDSEDPISLHKYLYTSANPIRGNDPSGYMSLAEEEGVSGIQGSLAGMEGGSFNSIFKAVGNVISGISAEQAVVGLLADATFQVFSLAALNLVSGVVGGLRDGSFAAKWGSFNSVKAEAAELGYEGTSAANRYMFEEYKAELRAAMAKPYVRDAELAEAMSELYRADARIGSGSTAAAIRYEIETGAHVGGRWHLLKGRETIEYLEGWLVRNPTASAGDRAAAENVILDLKQALGSYLNV